MKMNLKSFLSAFAIVLVTACAPLYTPETTWDSDLPDDTFRPALTACVSQFDPSHLYQMDDDGEYAPTGLFVDTARTQAVVSCMEARGWDAQGWDWYSGPQR